MAEGVAQDIQIHQDGAAALVELTRVRALNALTVAMRAEMARAIPPTIKDPNVYALVIRSASERAFCAGADVREICQIWREDNEQARAAFAAEYALNWTLECYTKPIVSLMSGMVMGSGVGISAYGTHRVAGDGYRFAMPETAIGLFPDVGIGYVLARLPHEIGLYLGLTGRQMGPEDAYALDLVTHCIPSSQFDEIVAQLADAQPVDPLLDDRHVAPGESELLQRGETIAHCFSGASMEDILTRLGDVKGTDSEWAREVAGELGKKSPLSLKVTLRHIRAARAMDIRETLRTDYRLACSFLESGDFHEGVRAALIDKDGAPKWQPARLDAVGTDLVNRMFERRAGDELDLPERLGMQGAHR